MEEYKKYLKNDQTDWLLERENPTVRYLALKELINLDDRHSEVIDAQEQVMKSKPVKLLLAQQFSDGHWGDPGWSMHLPNTSGRLWMLADIGADKMNPQIKRAVDYLLESWMTEVYNDESIKSIRSEMGYPTDWGFDTCMHGLSLHALLRLGDISDQRIQKMINWVVRKVRFDDGDRILPQNLQNKKLCQGKHTCIWGSIAIIKALTEIPESILNDKVRETINKSIEFFLIHNINRRSHDLTRYLNQKLNQLAVSSDFVTILTAITKMGIIDERMYDSVRYLIKKQTKDGKWKLQRPADCLESLFGIKGEPSRWVTLRAMIALKSFFRTNPINF